MKRSLGMCCVAIGMHVIHVLLADEAASAKRTFFSTLFADILSTSSPFWQVDLIIISINASNSVSLFFPTFKFLFGAPDAGAFDCSDHRNTMMSLFMSVWPLSIKVFDTSTTTLLQLHWDLILCLQSMLSCYTQWQIGKFLMSLTFVNQYLYEFHRE